MKSGTSAKSPVANRQTKTKDISSFGRCAQSRARFARPLKKTLDRVISKAGLGSRTEARCWIGNGRVRVNGKLIQTPDHWVDPVHDKVTLDGRPLTKPERRYILLYKPKGFITTYRDPQGRQTVYDLIPGLAQFVGTVGRLDLDTSGLLLLTNDNGLAEAMTNPEHELSKTYLVKASTLLSNEQLQQLASGVQLSDGPTRPAKVHRVRDSAKCTFLELTITEGRNRQVRRMLEAVGSKVLKLVRIRLGPLTLEGLQIGKWRELSRDEVSALRKLCGAKRKS
jgi:23S rRNA pseudouridine2605 synthase